MARQLRLEYEGAFYHVTARGNERRKIYFSEYDYQKFREYLGTAQDKYGYKSNEETYRVNKQKDRGVDRWDILCSSIKSVTPI
jgi:REP element-mobilizing transposase RayT